MMRAWASYAVTALGLAVAGSVVAQLVGPADVSRGIRVAAGLAWVVQVSAFAVLVWTRGQATLFMAAFVAGVLLRFVAVGTIAFWVTRTKVYPPAPTLVGLVGFVFVMLVFEPLFLKRGVPSA